MIKKHNKVHSPKKNVADTRLHIHNTHINELLLHP